MMVIYVTVVECFKILFVSLSIYLSQTHLFSHKPYLCTRVLIHVDILLESFSPLFAPSSILHSSLTFSFSSFSSFRLCKSRWQLGKHEGCQFLRWWSLCSQQPWFLGPTVATELTQRCFIFSFLVCLFAIFLPIPNQL